MSNIFDDGFIANHPVKHEIVMPFHKVDTVIPHCGGKRLVIIQRPTACRAHQIDNGCPEIGLGVVCWLLSAVVEYAILVIAPLPLRRIDDNDAIGFHLCRSISSQNDKAST